MPPHIQLSSVLQTFRVKIAFPVHADAHILLPQCLPECLQLSVAPSAHQQYLACTLVSAIGIASYPACIVLNSSIKAEGVRRRDNAYTQSW